MLSSMGAIRSGLEVKEISSGAEILRQGWGCSQVVTRVEREKFTKLMQIQICLCWGGLNKGKMRPACWLHRERTLHRENGVYPSNSHPIATKLSLSLYISNAS